MPDCIHVGIWDVCKMYLTGLTMCKYWLYVMVCFVFIRRKVRTPGRTRRSWARYHGLRQVGPIWSDLPSRQLRVRPEWGWQQLGQGKTLSFLRPGLYNWLVTFYSHCVCNMALLAVNGVCGSYFSFLALVVGTTYLCIMFPFLNLFLKVDPEISAVSLLML